MRLTTGVFVLSQRCVSIRFSIDKHDEEVEEGGVYKYIIVCLEERRMEGGGVGSNLSAEFDRHGGCLCQCWQFLVGPIHTKHHLPTTCVVELGPDQTHSP